MKCASCDTEKDTSDFPFAYKGCKSKRKEVCRKCDKKAYLAKYYISNLLNERRKEKYRSDENMRSRAVCRSKLWRQHNRIKSNESGRIKRNENHIQPLSDWYIINLLKNVGITDPSNELIYAYRLKIQIQREIGVTNSNLNK